MTEELYGADSEEGEAYVAIRRFSQDFWILVAKYDNAGLSVEHMHSMIAVYATRVDTNAWLRHIRTHRVLTKV